MNAPGRSRDRLWKDRAARKKLTGRQRPDGILSPSAERTTARREPREAIMFHEPDIDLRFGAAPTTARPPHRK